MYRWAPRAGDAAVVFALAMSLCDVLVFALSPQYAVGVMLANIPFLIILAAMYPQVTWKRYTEHSTIPIVEFTSSGKILRTNNAFEELLGPCVNLFDMVRPSLRTGSQDMREMLRKGERAAFEVELCSDPNYAGILNIMRDNNYIIGIFTDIIEFKALEVQFYHSQKMQAIGQLAGGIAHDFNNIMTTVLGVCDLLLMRHTPNDPSFVGIKQIQQNAIRAINLVKQLLAFSRKQILTPLPANISEILDELASNLLCRLIGENIKLELELDRDQWMVKVDESQFEQIIINLAVNARDAMPKGGHLKIKTRHITIETDNGFFGIEKLYAIDQDVLKAGEYIVIEISDTGVGIPEDKIHKIFEPFYSTKPMSLGSGLGLATVYGIVKQTGGHVFLKSQINQGTTFYVFLRSIGPEALTVPEKVFEEEAIDVTGTETIMVVEDELYVRSLCASALKNKGYNVIEAESCEEALEIFRERHQSISLVITDIVMSGMRGSDLVVMAREIKPDVQIILISGYTENMISEELTSTCAVLPKPFTLKQLATVVRQMLGKQTVKEI